MLCSELLQTLSCEYSLRAPPPPPCPRRLHPACRTLGCDGTGYVPGTAASPPAAATYSGKRGSYSIQLHTSHSCLRGNSACRCSGLSPAHRHPRVRGYSCRLREMPAFRGAAVSALSKGLCPQHFSGRVYYFPVGPPVICERAQAVFHFIPA